MADEKDEASLRDFEIDAVDRAGTVGINERDAPK
jgi:hypothetical protein